MHISTTIFVGHTILLDRNKDGIPIKKNVRLAFSEQYYQSFLFQSVILLTNLFLSFFLSFHLSLMYVPYLICYSVFLSRSYPFPKNQHRHSRDLFRFIRHYHICTLYAHLDNLLAKTGAFYLKCKRASNVYYVNLCSLFFTKFLNSIMEIV